MMRTVTGNHHVSSNYATLSVVDYDKMENVPRSRVRMIKYIQSRFTEQPMHAFME